MADVKITELDAIASVAAADVIPIVDDVAGTPITKKATITQVSTAVSNALGITTLGSALINDATTGDMYATLGITTVASALFDDTSTGAMQTTLGISSYAQTLLDDTSAGAAQLTLGITTVASALLDDTSYGAMRTTMGVAIGSDVQAYDADILKADVSDNLVVGYTVTSYSAGTKSSGTFTPDPALGNFQYAVNGGAHTLAPPATDSNMVIQYTNNGSAGAITTSGFTKVTGSFTTTNGDDFLAYITRCNAFSHLNIVALQ